MIKLNNSIVDLNRFPDGTLALDLDSSLYHIRSPFTRLTWLYDSDEEMFAISCIVDILRRNGRGSNIIFDLPYVPNSRMDRIKNKEENFSLKVFAEWLNSLNFTKVWTFNVHSNVSEALINNLENALPEEDIERIFRFNPNKYDMIFFPDEGACKRYSDMRIIKELNLPVSFGIKKRDWKTGKILGLDVIGQIAENQRVIIVDDICSKGNTFYYSGLKLKELGAKTVDLYVSHCENTIEKGELLKENSPITKIYTTDSICTIENPKIEILKRFRRLYD